SRREFLRRSALATAAVCVTAGLTAAERPARKLFTGIGITAAVEQAAEMKDYGADFLVESVTRLLVPDRPESEFEPLRAKAAAAPLPVLGCNGFLRDPKLRCVGPDADPPRVLAFAATTFERLHKARGEYIVFGSNTARQIPEGWTK